MKKCSRVFLYVDRNVTQSRAFGDKLALKMHAVAYSQPERRAVTCIWGRAASRNVCRCV